MIIENRHRFAINPERVIIVDGGKAQGHKRDSV
jgi:hypothetical protein